MNISAKFITAALIVMASLISARHATAKSVRLFASRGQTDHRLIHLADFDPAWSRYPSPYDLINYFRSTLPLASRSVVSQDCLSITPANRALLGVDDPVIGAPLLRKPTAQFVSWYSRCAGSLINANYVTMTGSVSGIAESARLKIAASYAAGGVADSCVKIQNSGSELAALLAQLNSCEWRSLPKPVKLALVNSWVTELIGPEDVLRDLGIANSSSEVAQTVIDTIDGFDAKPSAAWTFLAVPQSQTLKVDAAVRMTQFLIMMTDAFQY